MTSQSWRQAWQDALYGPAGFYTRPEGPAGHFATSAQGIPGVSEILAQAIVAYAEQTRADVVVDFACGRGELLQTMHGFAPSGMHFIGVDVVPRPANLAANIEWIRSPGGAEIPSLEALSGRRALVLAHEWLDVVPCDIVEFDDAGVAREVLVTTGGVESLGATVGRAERIVGPSSLTDPQPARAGERVELPGTRDVAWRALVNEVRRCAAAGSVVLGVDYAMYAADAPALGTLTGFRHGTECTPTPDGSCDITTHVVLDGLDLAASPRRQRDVLIELFGEEPLAPVPIELASAAPSRYLERLATRSAFAAATAREGLGDFFWFWQQT